MRERRGRIGRTVGAVADSIASAARRSGPRPGEPRVVVYDAGGHATLLRPDSPEHKRILDAAERMIGLWAEPGGGAIGPAPEAE
jgi:hypothetical protein